MMFVGAVSGKAEEAIRYYASVFRNAKVGEIHRHENGTVQFATFTLEGKDFAAMDGGNEHKFSFNEAISFMVHCDTQQEVDYYWDKLTAVPSAEACGWLKDKYGFSWQIIPTAMEKLLGSKDEQKLAKKEAKHRLTEYATGLPCCKSQFFPNIFRIVPSLTPSRGNPAWRRPLA